MNIIILICDALRAQNLGCYGYDKPISPNIDKIASQGAIFKNAFCTINTTDASFTTIFTGQFPCVHGLKHHGNEISKTDKSFIDNMIFLPEILHQNGYTTSALDWLGRWHRLGYDFYAGQKNSLVDRKSIIYQNTDERRAISKYLTSKITKISLLPNRGNWYYYLHPSIRQTLRSGMIFWNDLANNGFSRKKKPIISDSAGLSDMAIRYIKRYAKKKNLMLFVHFWDNHIPYTAPNRIFKELIQKYDYSSEPVASVLNQLGNTKAAELIHKTTRGKTPETVGEIRAYYDASIKYVDTNIGKIYKTLEELDIAEDTLFIISSDHGESLGEHGIYFDHHGLYEQQTRVPLIMANTVFPPGSCFNEMVQHDDIVPTILDLAKIEPENICFTGKSLLQLVKNKKWDREFVFIEEKASQHKRMIRDHKYKYTQAMNNEKCRYCQVHHSKTDEFYDLQNDPKELKNIINNPKSTEYLKKMEDFLETLPKPRTGEITHFKDEAIVNERLKALGYF